MHVQFGARQTKRSHQAENDYYCNCGWETVKDLSIVSTLCQQLPIQTAKKFSATNGGPTRRGNSVLSLFMHLRRGMVHPVQRPCRHIWNTWQELLVCQLLLKVLTLHVNLVLSDVLSDGMCDMMGTCIYWLWRVFSHWCTCLHSVGLLKVGFETNFLGPMGNC